MWCIKIFSLILVGSKSDGHWHFTEKASWMALLLSVLLAFSFFGYLSLFAWFYYCVGVFLYWWLTFTESPEPDDDEPEHQDPPLPGNELPSIVARQFLIILLTCSIVSGNLF